MLRAGNFGGWRQAVVFLRQMAAPFRCGLIALSYEGRSAPSVAFLA